MTRGLLAGGLCVAVLCSGCIASRSEDSFGQAHFGVSTGTNSADYAPTGTAGQPAPSATAGTASLPPAPSPRAGTTAPPIAGTGATVPLAGGSGPSPAGAGSSARAGSGGAVALPAAGSTGSQPGAAGAAGAPPATGSGGTLTLQFTSVGGGGRYAPRNVGAVWIETGGGMFVKTLERWAGIRANHLEQWNSKSGGWGSRFGGGGNTADQMDAVTRATLRTHEKHQVSWDMQDVTGKSVPEGKYKLVIEVNDDNRRPGVFSAVEFERGGAPQTITAPDAPPFTGLTLTYQP